MFTQSPIYYESLIKNPDMGLIVYCYISEERDALLNENDNWITSGSELI
jgi:hypothetical protein